MIITGLVAKNCYSFDDIALSTDEFPVIQIIGNNLDEKRISKEDSGDFYSNANGVGKTNLYNLIIQALYSRDIYKTKKAFLSNLYSKESFLIKLFLVINNDIYKVHYSSSECLLYKNGKIFLEGRQIITEFFEDLIPFELFLRLTYLSPKIYFPFFESTNKEQQEFLSLIFKDLLTLKKKLPKIKEERQQLQKQVVDLEKEIHHLKQQKSQKFEAEKQLPKKPEIEDYSSKISSLNIKKGNLSQQLTKYNEIINKLNSIKIDKVSFDENKLLALHSEGTNLKKELEKIDSELTQLNQIRGAIYCPTCLRELDAESINKRVEYLLSSHDTVVHKLNLCKSEYSAESLKKQKYKKAKEQEGRKAQLYEQLETINKTKIEEELTELDKHLTSIKRKQNENDKLLNQYNSQVNQIIAFNAQQKAIKRQVQEATKQLQIVESELIETKKTVQILLTLEEVCNKVVVAKQIPNRLKILESFINEELANYTSQYSVQLSMKNDKIVKNITKEGKTYPVENLSSGEKTRLNIALLFAVRHILLALQKTIYNINLVFFDEVFGTLDVSGRNILIDTIKEYGLNQFIVSHSYINPDYPVLELVRKNNKTRLKDD